MVTRLTYNLKWPYPLTSSGLFWYWRCRMCAFLAITGCCRKVGHYLEEETVPLEESSCSLYVEKCRGNTTDKKITDIKIRALDGVFWGNGRFKPQNEVNVLELTQKGIFINFSLVGKIFFLSFMSRETFACFRKDTRFCTPCTRKSFHILWSVKLIDLTSWSVYR